MLNDAVQLAMSPQLNAHVTAGTFGDPVPCPDLMDGEPLNILWIQWSNLVKLDGTWKAQACIDGMAQNVLLHGYISLLRHMHLVLSSLVNISSLLSLQLWVLSSLSGLPLMPFNNLVHLLKSASYKLIMLFSPGIRNSTTKTLIPVSMLSHLNVLCRGILKLVHYGRK